MTGERTFENTIAPFARMDRELSPIISSCDFAMVTNGFEVAWLPASFCTELTPLTLQHVSSDEAIRNASCEVNMS